MIRELDYDGSMFMRTDEPREEFTSGIFYKLFLGRYVRDVSPGIVRFKTELTYIDFRKIIELCRKDSSSKGITMSVSEALKSYIDSREMYIDLRSRLGIEIKSHDPKLMGEYSKYKAAVDSMMLRKLREKQMWDSFFMFAMQKSANFSVPGSGKTASVLGVYARLKSLSLVRRIIVICPKNAFGSWIDEFELCFGNLEPLNVLNVHDKRFTNSTQRLNALKYDSGSCNLILVNYEAAGSLEDGIIPLVNDSSLLVFDEVHKVKRVEGKYAKHALNISKNAKYVAVLTGTPIPNSYADIYNLLHILYPDEYDEFFNFAVPMLRKPDDDEIKEINDKLQPFFCRTAKDELGVPPANDDDFIRINVPESECRLFKILRMKYRRNPLAFLIRLLQMESSPKMLLDKLDLSEFAYLLDDSADVSGIDYSDYSEEVRSLINSIGATAKFASCVQKAESLVSQGKTVIIWCIFLKSIDTLSEALRKKGINARCIYGEVPLDERRNILEQFRSGEIQVLLTNPHTLAESVSLHSVCHDAIYYEYSYNLVHLLQSKDRIHRLGLPDGQYTQYYYEQVFYQTDDNDSWSLDEEIYNRLKAKEKIMLEAIQNRTLEIMPTSEEDLRIIFEKLISR